MARHHGLRRGLSPTRIWRGDPWRTLDLQGILWCTAVLHGEGRIAGPHRMVLMR